MPLARGWHIPSFRLGGIIDRTANFEHERVRCTSLAQEAWRAHFGARCLTLTGYQNPPRSHLQDPRSRAFPEMGSLRCRFGLSDRCLRHFRRQYHLTYGLVRLLGS